MCQSTARRVVLKAFKEMGEPFGALTEQRLEPRVVVNGNDEIT